jgi:prophage DNA circulation protein
MSIDIIGEFSEDLLAASIAGVQFWMVDADDEGGRRVLRFLFPDQDQAQFEDLGQIDGEINVTGLLIGDDYIDQAQNLRAAFRTPGPWTLFHPWQGELQVVQAGEKLPKISVKQEELRVARFTASFYLWDPPDPPSPDTYQDLSDSLDDITSSAEGLLAAVFAPIALTLAAVGLVENFADTAIGIWNTAVAGANATIGAAVAPPIATLGAIETLTTDETYPGNVAAAFSGVSGAIAQTSAPIIPAVVAPGGSTALPIAVDGRITATIILAAVTAIAALPTGQPSAPALSLAVQALALADAVRCASNITFDSQQEAATWQQTLTTALSATATQAASLAATQATAAGTLWRSLVAAQSSLAADMNATIGRLPAVTVFTPPQPAPVWLLAQYLAGDTPGSVLAVYLDLVKRNSIINPAVPQAGPLEVLL